MNVTFMSLWAVGQAGNGYQGHRVYQEHQGQTGVEHTSATMHALLFTGHAHALAGRPAQALAAFTRYTAEVERRQVPRFAGRAVNFAGWVLRNLGAYAEALDHHHQALEAGRGQGTADVTVAALEDLAEQALETGDGDGAAARLAEAGALAVRAAELGVPRYESVARLLGYRADHALGVPVDYAAVEVDLDLLDRCVAIEAWQWTCDLAADFGLAAWRDRALDRASRLARDTSEYSDVVRQEADRRLTRRPDRHPGRGGGLWLRL